MSFRKRPSAQFKAVSVLDENIYQIPKSKLTKYFQTRDFTVLGDLSEYPQPITVLHITPLKVEYESERENLAIPGQISNAAWRIFSTHVKGAENCTDQDGEPLLRWTDESPRRIESDCRKNILPDIVLEIASMICQKANADTEGFTVPERFWVMSVRYQALRANDANTNTQTSANQEAT